MKILIENFKLLDIETYNIELLHKKEVFITDDEFPYHYTSQYGRVYSTLHKKILTPSLNGKLKTTKYLNGTKEYDNRYYRVKIKKSNNEWKIISIHRRVAQIFVTNPDQATKIEVHHKDKNQYNNYYLNLQWVARDEHKLLDANKKLYLYNACTQNMMSFKSIDRLEKYLEMIIFKYGDLDFISLNKLHCIINSKSDLNSDGFKYCDLGELTEKLALYVAVKPIKSEVA